ncbi:MAG: Spy/CpxP family protein refolding chaperone [Pseudolabrys sp.]|nr:Spy/CpxP family protein refolding chaperone [Pseudolabrys sp.]MBV9954940.1 Spy/CpxP family protein refolding chaperone [Pseudolabrys sp.]
MKKLASTAIVVSLLSLIGMAASVAQPMMGPGWGGGPGMMGRGGPGMMWQGRGYCGGGAGTMAAWRLERIERLVRLTPEQRPAFEKLRTAMQAASDNAGTACAAEFPRTAPERLEFMEKRMAAMLTNMSEVRTAFQSFYDTLTNEQKVRIDQSWPGRGWRYN